jgi:hypothetical protein
LATGSSLVWTGSRLGIGTTSPGDKITIATGSGTGAAMVFWGNGVGAANELYIGQGASNEAYVFNRANNYLVFGTNGTEAMRIDTSQNLLVGTTTAVTGYKIHMAGAIYQDQSANGSAAGSVVGGGYVCGPNSTTIYAGMKILNQYLSNNTSEIAFYTTSSGGSAAEAMRIDPSGNLLIGTTSITSQGGKLFVVASGSAIVTQVPNGNTAYQSTNTSGTSSYYAAIWSNNGTSFSTCGYIQVSGTSTSYVTSSDYRLKEDVQPMTGALAKVALLKPVTYKWKSDGTDGEGFIAHELAEICPHAVAGEKDALKEDGSIMPQGIDTSFLVATLTSAIQELSALVTAQSATITSLTERIAALESKTV